MAAASLILAQRAPPRGLAERMVAAEDRVGSLRELKEEEEENKDFRGRALEEESDKEAELCKVTRRCKAAIVAEGRVTVGEKEDK